MTPEQEEKFKALVTKASPWLDKAKERIGMNLIKEIRIGNWINGNGKDFQVYIETFADIESTYGNFKPIELTEEWLLKFGFKNSKGSEYDYRLQLTGHGNEGNLLWADLERKQISIPTENSDWVFCNGFHVHNLQNTYHSITGSELTIK